MNDVQLDVCIIQSIEGVVKGREDFLNARKEDIPLEKPAWFLGNMGNWEVYRKLKIDWFLIRWLTARNALSLFCLILIIVTLVLLFTA